MDLTKNISLLRDCKDCRIYEYKSDNNHFIIKELLSPARVSRMKKEITFCSKLKKRFPDFPCVIPHPTHKETIYYQDFIEGQHYLDLALSCEQKEKIVKIILQCIQRIELIDIGIEDYISVQQWKALVERNITQFACDIKKYEIIEHCTLDKVCLWLKSVIKRISSEIKMVYVHNDLNKENIIINNKEEDLKVYLIDFEKVIVADPLKEISKLIWLFRADPEFGNIFWDEYSKNRKASKEILKGYWVYDILLHLKKYNDLLQITGWKTYLNEEINILSKVVEDDYKLW